MASLGREPANQFTTHPGTTAGDHCSPSREVAHGQTVAVSSVRRHVVGPGAAAMRRRQARGYRFRVRSGEWVRFVIRFEILDRERFREMAAAMVAVSLDEPGTVVYDWYVDDAAGTGTLYEAYASAEALRAHGSGAVFTELAPRYADAVRVAQVDAFGAAEGLPRRDVLGAPTTWWGAPIAAVTEAG